MDKLVIEGGSALSGEVSISGAKNGSLALMPASILAPGNYNFFNTPQLNDVETMKSLLETLGCEISFTGTQLTINSSGLNKFEAPYELVKKMRASFYILGPLVARWGYAKVSLPGGCAWGPRPVDLHLKGLKALGAEIDLQQGYVIAKAEKLIGCKFHLDISSVGATGNLLMAAVLAKGETLITNAAMEPEIVALAELLIQMGAKISGAGTSAITIQGVDELSTCDIDTIPDRIEAATYLIAGAMTKGNITVKNAYPDHLTAVLDKLKESGCQIEIHKNNDISLSMSSDPIPTDIDTAIYPGFPTDVQAQWTAYMMLAKGKSIITDNIYNDRFKHVPELIRLGGNIEVKENLAIVRGGEKLSGASVMSSDLRGGASLVLSGLVAEGITEVLRIYHIDRGYEKIEEKFNKIKSKVFRKKTELF